MTRSQKHHVNPYQDHSGSPQKARYWWQDEEDSDPKPWDRQDWDSDLSYSRFVEYYLTQEDKRTLVEAYKRYRLSTGTPQEKVDRIKHAPGTWNNWAYGRDSRGNSIPGAWTWTERSRAYDTHRYAELMMASDEKWRERREGMLEQEYLMSQKLNERANRMLQAPLFAKDVEETYSEDGQTHITEIKYRPTDWSERDIVAMVQMASKLRRQFTERIESVTHRQWELMALSEGIDPDLLREAAGYLLGEYRNSAKHRRV